MRVPSVPHHRLIDERGYISTPWRIYFELMTRHLQNNFSNQGVQVPDQATNNLPLFADETTQGRLQYNLDQTTALVNQQIPITGGSGVTLAFKYNPLTTYHEFTTAELNAIPSGARNGKIVYNTTTDSVFIGVNDEFREVTTS